MKYIEYEGLRIQHGDAISCTINYREVLDAKVSFYNGRVYLCQNYHDGKSIPKPERFGYRYSWVIDGGYGKLALNAHNVHKFKVIAHETSYEVF